MTSIKTETVKSKRASMKQTEQIRDKRAFLEGRRQEAFGATDSWFYAGVKASEDWQALTAHPAPAVAQGEVAGYQFRTRPVHHREKGWSAWEPCDKQLFDACKKIPVNGDFELESREAYSAAPAVAQEPVAFNGWYCAQCQRGVDPSEVTFHETHETCGRYITDDVPPAAAVVQGEVAGWIQFVDGKQTQNFCRDKDEMQAIDKISRLMNKTLNITYQPVYTHPAPAVAQGEPVGYIHKDDLEKLLAGNEGNYVTVGMDTRQAWPVGPGESKPYDHLIGIYTEAPAPAVMQEPVHFRAVICKEQQEQALGVVPKIVGFVDKKAAEQFILEKRDFQGWRYSLEPLYREAPAVAQSWELNEETAKFLADLILANDEPTPVTLSVGFIKDDDGKIQHGLRVHESEYPEEGGELLVESTPSPQKAPPAEVVRELVETLQWYQEQARLCRLIHSEGDTGRNALANDGGNRAKAALKSAKEHGL